MRRPDHGIAWQRQLEVVHDGYRRDQRATIWKTEPGVKVLSQVVDGKFRAAWSADGPPDFMGVAQGVFVVFDAKSIEADKFPCANLKPHQARDLEAARTNGGQSFLALRASDGVGWVVPWLTFGPIWWAWHEATKARSVRASFRPDEIGIRMPAPGDWLPLLGSIQ